MTIGVPIVTYLRRVRRIHKVRVHVHIRVRRIEKAAGGDCRQTDGSFGCDVLWQLQLLVWASPETDQVEGDFQTNEVGRETSQSSLPVSLLRSVVVDERAVLPKIH